MLADALAAAPAWRNNKHRWLWVPDQRSLCSLVRDDVNFVPEAGSNFQTAETISYTPPPSRGAMRPSFEKTVRPKKTEGAGNAACPMHRQPRVRNKTKHTSVVTTGSPDSFRHSPRNGFNGFLRALLGGHAVLPPSSCGYGFV